MSVFHITLTVKPAHLPQIFLSINVPESAHSARLHLIARSKCGPSLPADQQMALHVKPVVALVRALGAGEARRFAAFVLFVAAQIAQC